jgi:hypothetical protein
MRAYSWLCSGLLAVLCSCVSRQQEHPPTFKNRALVSLPGKHTGLMWLKTRGNEDQLSAEIIREHGAVSEHTLLVRDPVVVDSLTFDSDSSGGTSSGEWAFAAVVRAAFRQAGAPNPDAQSLVTQMVNTLEQTIFAGIKFESSWRQRSPAYRLEMAPVHLLAVVNRMDLAQVAAAPCQQGELRGAELRFVYAAPHEPPAQDPHDLRLIVEFVLPCLAKNRFKIMAQDWYSLKDEAWSGQSPPYFSKIIPLLSEMTAMAKTVRLRVNGEDGLDTWDTREYEFSPHGIKQVNLDRQLPSFNNSVCQKAITPIGSFAIKHAREIIASNYIFEDENLLTDAGQIAPDLNTVLTLDKHVLTDDQRDDVRFSLSLNSCTACHGSETRTRFHHIHQRQRGTASDLSGFLTGSSDCSASSVTSGVSYCPVNPPLNTNCGVHGSDRNFNDLLRRHLYLDAVRNLSATSPDTDWQRALEPFIAYQGH